MTYTVEVLRMPEFGAAKTTIGPISKVAAEAIAMNLAGQQGVISVKLKSTRSR